MHEFDTPPLRPVESDHDWHYIDRGAQKGPVSANEMQALLGSKALHPESQVWRRGMDQWKPIRETDLVATVADIPPPVPGDQIRNSLVWMVAILPMVIGIIDASLASQPGAVWGRALSPHIDGSFREPEVPWQIHAMINSVLLFWDERRLNKAGYSTPWTTVFAVFLAPVYLFVRAKRLKQRPSYAVTWISLTLLALVLVASAQT